MCHCPSSQYLIVGSPKPRSTGTRAEVQPKFLFLTKQSRRPIPNDPCAETEPLWSSMQAGCWAEQHASSAVTHGGPLQLAGVYPWDISAPEVKLPRPWMQACQQNGRRLGGTCSLSIPAPEVNSPVFECRQARRMEGGWGASVHQASSAPEVNSSVFQCRRARRMEGGWGAAACRFNSRV